MNVTNIITKDYENISNWAICENEPKQTQPVVSLPAMSAVEGVEPISKQNMDNSLMINLLYCIQAYFIRKSRIWKNCK